MLLMMTVLCAGWTSLLLIYLWFVNLMGGSLVPSHPRTRLGGAAPRLGRASRGLAPARTRNMERGSKQRYPKHITWLTGVPDRARWTRPRPVSSVGSPSVWARQGRVSCWTHPPTGGRGRQAGPGQRRSWCSGRGWGRPGCRCSTVCWGSSPRNSFYIKLEVRAAPRLSF